ncbi:MAG: hypothetical protein DMD35_03040 [Gemmatimonadetes bacterium]|nr:MAG: hypothetical protein DMD35_03040 [Gemmatimonadota bacterium]
MDEQRSKGSTDGLGDDQGTRVGAPDQSASAPRQHSDGPTGRPSRQTGAGSEASEGMHNAQQGGGRSEGDRSGLSGQETGRSTRDGDERAGSEPLPEDDQHRSGYGGSGGRPVNSSDTRERNRGQ